MTRGLLTIEQRDRLRQALASGSRLGASDLRLINVDVYKQRLGQNWFKYKNIIHNLAADAIKVELTREDFFVETKHGYGIFFFNKTADEVRLISARIAEHLRRELSREPAFGHPPLCCEATSVNCDNLLRELDGAHGLSAGAQGSGYAIKTPPSSYAPLWHAKLQRVVGSVFAPPVARRVKQPDKSYYATSDAIALRDIREFSAMLADAYRIHKAGMSTTIIFSLNFRTFCSVEHNKDYMLALRQTPAALVQYLTPRLVRIPPGTAQPLLAGRAQSLASIFKHVVAHTRPVVQFGTFDFVPCSLLSTSWQDIRTAMRTDAPSPHAAANFAKQFARSAKSLRLNSVITGVDTMEALDAALAADVEFISGGAVLPRADTPFQQSLLSVEEVRARAAEPPLAAAARVATADEPEDDGVIFI